MLRERNRRLDNMRALLIVLVVMGHLNEVLFYPYADYVYRLIYTFHMPGFAMLSGLCEGGKKEEGYLLKKLLYPYLIFQTLYLFFQYFTIDEKAGELVLQYSAPYWLMWYLVALIAWKLMAGALPMSGCRAGLASVVGTIIAAVLAGQDGGIGSFLALSRVMVLFPFFITGIWLHRYFPNIIAVHTHWWGKLIAAVGFLCGAAAVWHWKDRISYEWLYQRACYVDGEYTPAIRLGFIVFAAFMLGCLLVIIPNRRIAVVSRLGQNTMPVFLIHGFIVRLISKHGLFQSIAYERRGIIVLVLAIVISLVLSSPPVVWLTGPLMKWPFNRRKS